MPIVNLKQQYPHLHSEVLFEVSDPIFEVYDLHRRKEASYERKRQRHKAIYSLDVGDGIENDAVCLVPSPEDIWLENIGMAQLHEALDHIPAVQARRVYARFVLGMKNIAIAKREGLTASSVSDSIQIGLKNLRAYYEQYLGRER